MRLAVPLMRACGWGVRCVRVVTCAEEEAEGVMSVGCCVGGPFGLKSGFEGARDNVCA